MEKNQVLEVHIDNILQDRKTKELIIIGWALNKNSKQAATIKCDNKMLKKDPMIESLYRSDVNALHKVSSDVNSGFSIRLLPNGKSNQLRLLFESEKNQIEETIDLSVNYPAFPGTESKFERLMHKIPKGMRYLKQHGIKSTLRRMQIDQTKPDDHYQEWIRKNEPSDYTAYFEAVDKFEYQPKISILMPVYNVEEKWLRKCISSVENQIYKNWELCMADDASTDNKVIEVLKEYMKKDNRIKVVFRKENGHICKATNSALEIATGEFSTLLDNDDELPITALYEVVNRLNQNPDLDLIYSDEDKIDMAGKRLDPAFKPDWSPDLLLGTNYISHLGTYRTSIMKQIGGFRPGYEGSQDFDLVLRFTEQTTASRIAHIPKILYHWRMVATSTAVNQGTKSYAFEAGRLALVDALKRRGLKGTVTHAAGNGLYDVHYEILKRDLVSIIIPTRDGYDDVKRCVDSIINKSTYDHYEIIMADNGSTDLRMQELYNNYIEKLGKDKFIVQLIDIPFNFSKINNIAAKVAKGKYLLFLNNDTEVISPDWIDTMVSFCQFERIGAVGAKLYYPNNTIQHAGVILGLGGAAGHGHHTFPRGDFGYFGRLEINVNYFAVTAACMMIKAIDFNDLNGFNEDLVVAFNDVDLCIRCHELGKDNIWAHRAELYHFESQSRGYETTPEKQKRFEEETRYMDKKWGRFIDNDPYYSPNLTRTGGNYDIRL